MIDSKNATQQEVYEKAMKLVSKLKLVENAMLLGMVIAASGAAIAFYFNI